MAGIGATQVPGAGGGVGSNVNVTNFPATQPVSGTVTANQGTNPWTDNITQIGGAAFSLGQQLAASSLPVVLTASQLTTLTPPSNTGYALDATLTGGNAIVKQATAANFNATVVGQATGSGVPSTAFYSSGQAINAEVAARSNGNLGGLVTDLVGKLITMPYANKENFLSGIATATGTAAASVISAQGAGVKIYITRAIIVNTGATTSLVTIQNDPTGTPSTLAYAINPSGGGSNMVFDPPLISAANKAVGWTPGSASTTQYITLIGYAGS